MLPNFHLSVVAIASFGLRMSDDTIPEHPRISPLPKSNIAEASPVMKKEGEMRERARC